MLPTASGTVMSQTLSPLASDIGIQVPHHPLNVPFKNTPAAVEPPPVI